MGMGTGMGRELNTFINVIYTAHSLSLMEGQDGRYTEPFFISHETSTGDDLELASGDQEIFFHRQ